MYINTVQLTSCHLHGDTCNKNNIDKIDITLLCFCIAYPFQKGYQKTNTFIQRGMTEILIPFCTANTELPELT